MDKQTRIDDNEVWAEEEYAEHLDKHCRVDCPWCDMDQDAAMREQAEMEMRKVAYTVKTLDFMFDTIFGGKKR